MMNKNDSNPKSLINAIIPTNIKTMDLTSPKLFNHVLVKELDLETNPRFYGKSNENPFADTFHDPLCKLNLKETSEFVRSLPNVVEVSAQRQRRLEAPTTPGRPFFRFPSKWVDAEKWLTSSESPAHGLRPLDPPKIHKQCEDFKQNLTNGVSVSTSFQVPLVAGGVSDVTLKDKFTDDVLEVEPMPPNIRYSEPSQEAFMFRNSATDTSTELVHHKDVGTEMTPLGSSTTSRCPTPFTISSPARHNTPETRSGPMAIGNLDCATLDMTELEVCHLAKLQLGTQYDSVASNWSSKEEEEEEISKSLRHSETGNGCPISEFESRAKAWEEEEKTKCCLRYQREEAKVQAWVNLQSAKAEAKAKKLEVKIQKMRSNLEEKLMKKQSVVQRKAEEWRISAQQQHKEQTQKANGQMKKMLNLHSSQLSSHRSCGCFPCNRP